MKYCLEAWCSMDNSPNITIVNYIATFLHSMCKITSGQRLRLLLYHQIRNSCGSLCKTTVKIISQNNSTTVLRFYNQQAGKLCFTKMFLGIEGATQSRTEQHMTGNT